MNDYICVHPIMRLVSKDSNRINGLTKTIMRCNRCKYREAELSWWEGNGLRTVPKLIRTVISTQNGSIVNETLKDETISEIK